METIKNLRSDCGQFIIPIQTLQKISKDEKVKLLDVGGGRTSNKEISSKKYRIL